MRASTLLFTLTNSEENQIKGGKLVCSVSSKKSKKSLLPLSKLDSNRTSPQKTLPYGNTDVWCLPGLVSDLPEQLEWHLCTH